MDPAARPPDRNRLLRWLSSLVSVSAELRRRKVVQVALMYVGGALVTLAAAETIVETYGLPEATRFVLGIVVLLGFPPAVLLAWVFDWTDDGIRRSHSTRVPPAVRRTVTIGAVLLLAGVGGLAAVAVLRAPERPSAALPMVMSVLPFEAAEPGVEGIANNLEASIEAALADIPGLTVIPAHAAAAHGALALDSLARRLGADFFLKATVGRDGNTVEVRIIDGQTQGLSNSATVKGPAGGENTFALPDSLAANVESSLRTVLGREVQLRAWNRGTESPAAAQARWDADGALERAASLARVDPDGFAREMEAVDTLLDTAERLDPGWMEVDLARAAAREVEAIGVAFVRGAEAATRVLERGISELDAVLEARPGHPDALAARGRLRWARYNFGTDLEIADSADALLDLAAADLETAARTGPGMGSAAATLAELYIYGRGEYGPARYWATQAWNRDAYLENRMSILAILAQTSLELGADPEAARWCGRLESSFPDFALAHSCALELMAWGDVPALPDSAWAAYDRIVARLGGPSSSASAYYGYAVAAVLARAELPDSARAVMGRLGNLSAAGVADERHWLEAAVRFRLGETARARELLKAYVADNPETAASIQRRRALRAYLQEPVRLEGL